MINITKISTEERNPKSRWIDRVSLAKQVEIIMSDEINVTNALERSREKLIKLISCAIQTVNKSGRIIYIGAGTSGRLGTLDASEILPTFGDDKTFVSVMAGGDRALKKPVENIEDDIDQPIKDLKEIDLTKNDLVIGIAASGRTPYVLAGIEYAKLIGAKTGAITTSINSKIADLVDFPVDESPGPEIITGSTRLKSGTFQKVILNTISTLVMVNKGKVYENLMIDVVATNKKLKSRAISIIKTLTSLDDSDCLNLLEEAKWSVKASLIMHFKGISYEKAMNLLKKTRDIKEFL